jgi:hypothetical protein
MKRDSESFSFGELGFWFSAIKTRHTEGRREDDFLLLLCFVSRGRNGFGFCTECGRRIARREFLHG